jgi:hypothetical protein
MKQWDGLEDSVIGQASIWNGNKRVEVLVYDADKMIKVFMDRDGMSEEEANEYIVFNIEGAYIGEDTPVLVWQRYDE